IALIGDNGTGKSTILKLITGTLLPDGGSIKLGSNVSIGYYDQEHAVLHMDKTIFDEISDAYPDLDNTRIRNVLAAFLFTGDDVFKLIKDTSGGERGRISLAKLMLSNANFLILDEPTNHLDINSKEILEKALNSYTGTVFYVSHDRYFINSTATGIVELSDKVLTKYIGNYDYYIEKKAVSVTDIKSEVSDTKSASREAYKASREEQNRLKRKQNEIAKLEKLIEEAEIRLGEIEELSSKDEIARDISKLMELHKEKESIDEKLIKYYEEWDSLQE
ncbi:MAG: ATP-binding cassette domain-containing protein, partial [Acutalibacteraceae bacterium]